MNQPSIVYLKITTYSAMSLAATHYYGKLVSDAGVGVELRHRLTHAQADALNQAHATHTYRAGTLSKCFDDASAIIAVARRVWKKKFPNARALVRGEPALAAPQRVIAGDRKYRRVVNALVSEYEGSRSGGAWTPATEEVCQRFYVVEQKFKDRKESE